MRNKIFLLLPLSVLATATLACSLRVGRITPAGFRHAEYPYQVVSDTGYPSESARLLPPGWRLDNFVSTTQGFKPKSSEHYKLSVKVDINGDGEPDKSYTHPRFDLRFEHSEHDGVIWLRTLPLSKTAEVTRLDVLMNRIVNSMSGAEQIADFNSAARSTSKRRPQIVILETRYAATLRSSTVRKVGNIDALVGDIEVANTDQLKLDPQARQSRVRLVILRPPFRQSVPGSKTASVPVLMVAGYANAPRDFDASVGDFESLLNRIAFQGTAPLLPVASPPPAPTPLAPAAPPPAASSVAPETPPAPMPSI